MCSVYGHMCVEVRGQLRGAYSLPLPHGLWVPWHVPPCQPQGSVLILTEVAVLCYKCTQLYYGHKWFYLFKKIVLFVCVCVYMYVCGVHTCHRVHTEVWGKFMGSFFFFYHVGSRGLSSGCQAGRQTPLTAEQSSGLYLFFQYQLLFKHAYMYVCACALGSRGGQRTVAEASSLATVWVPFM